jgi:hypothetical protein
MAPRRKHRETPSQGREFKLRIPQDVAAWIEAEAERQEKPMNRIIINSLADVPGLKRYRDFASQVEEMRNVLARYGARITTLDLSEQLIAAVDAVLKADGASAVQSAVDKLRVLRNAMLKTHKQGDERK